MSASLRMPSGASPARAFAPADTGRLDRPHLCVMVDAEESFDWDGPFSRANTAVAFGGVERAQAVFDRHGVRPCYLVGYPVAADDRAASTVRGWLREGRCEAGAHLHPWVTPPHEEVVCLANSYPCNLPEELERRKLRALSDAIEAALGRRATVYKAGRHGLRIERGGMLLDLGYEVDTSVLPLHDFSGTGGGPNFLSCPARPFWSDARSDAGGRLLHLPVTVAPGPIDEPTDPARAAAGRGTRRASFGVGSGGLRVPGLTSRSGAPGRAVLTPEGTALRDMQRLARGLVAGGQKVLVLGVHGPSFTPGHTPYARDAAEVEALLTRLDGFLGFFRAELGGVAATPQELRRALD